MVPCLHQGNIYTKRKLRVWRDQKCILLVGAKTILTCAGCQNTLSRGRRYRPRTESCVNWNGTYRHGTVFAPRKYLYQKEATGMERADMYSASRCNTPTYLCGPVKYPVSREAGIGPRTESCVICDGLIAMVPSLHQGNIYTKRKLRVWRDQKFIAASRCNNRIPTYADCQNTQSRGSIRAREGKLRKLGRTYRHGTVFAPYKIFIPKGSYGYGKTRNVFR